MTTAALAITHPQGDLVCVAAATRVKTLKELRALQRARCAVQLCAGNDNGIPLYILYINMSIFWTSVGVDMRLFDLHLVSKLFRFAKHSQTYSLIYSQF